MYLDSAYLAKYYVNEPDSDAVRELIRQARRRCSSVWAMAEVACVFRRHVREGRLNISQGKLLAELFLRHCEEGVWELLPLNDRLVRKTAVLAGGLVSDAPLRAGDAIHIMTALDAGESEIWTSDRHLLAAAEHFGVRGRVVTNQA